MTATLFDVASVVTQLAAERQRWRHENQWPIEPGGREFPSRDAMDQVVRDLKGVLFPLRLGPMDIRQGNEDFFVGYTLDKTLHALNAQVALELALAPVNDAAVMGIDSKSGLKARATQLTTAFAHKLPEIRRLLDTDVKAAYQGDPAAQSADEVLLCYPGIQAMIHHRVAHQLYRLGVPLLARMVAELAHSQTGIDIHPGATIGPAVFIDHGTGVVIGETAVIGQGVRLYQNVTLGAKRFPVGADGHLVKGQPRHPVVKDEVVIYAGATVLGRVTLGTGAVIGGNVWVTHDVPAGAHITQASSQQEEHSLRAAVRSASL